MNTELLQALWEAFPSGWFNEPGAKAICGARLVSMPRGNAWVLPPLEGQAARIAPADAHSGDTVVDSLRGKLELLPDMEDDLTLMLMLSVLGHRSGMRHPRLGGLHWYPKSSGKTHVGWTIATPSQSKVIAVLERDYKMSLITAMKMTRCTCGTGIAQAMCPQHGDKMHFPWK